MSNKRTRMNSSATAAKVGRALRRAAEDARRTASMHGLPIYVWESGRVMALEPQFGRDPRRVPEMAMNRVTVRQSVFRDLAFDEAEARVLEMRAELMAAIREHIKERGWTQSKAAKQLGITQSRVSALVKGAWRDFSADTLLLLAARAGLRPVLRLAA